MTEGVVAEVPVARVETVEIARQGPPGPPGPPGTGDMQTLIYDPQGRATNAFALDNHAGVLDAGVFT